MDLGIIKNFKTTNQKMILRRMAAAIENKEPCIIDVLWVLDQTKAAWVTKEIITNYFYRASFKIKEKLKEESDTT